MSGVFCSHDDLLLLLLFLRLIIIITNVPHFDMYKAWKVKACDGLKKINNNKKNTTKTYCVLFKRWVWYSAANNNLLPNVIENHQTATSPVF